MSTLVGAVLGALLGIAVLLAIRAVRARRNTAPPPHETEVPGAPGRRPVVLLVAIGVVVLGVVGGELVGSGDEAVTTTTRVDDRFRPVRDGVCEAAVFASRGDYEGARRLFFGQAHQGLHELAAIVTPREPAVSARMLEAKAVVEGVFAPNGATASLAQDLAVLGAATGRAMASAGARDPGPCA